MIGKSGKSAKHGKEGKTPASSHKGKDPPANTGRKLDKKNKDNSPKVKRTILGGFRATLRPKAKGQDATAAAASVNATSTTTTTTTTASNNSGNHGNNSTYKVSTAVLGAGGIASNGADNGE